MLSTYLFKKEKVYGKWGVTILRSRSKNIFTKIGLTDGPLGCRKSANINCPWRIIKNETENQENYRKKELWNLINCTKQLLELLQQDPVGYLWREKWHLRILIKIFFLVFQQWISIIYNWLNSRMELTQFLDKFSLIFESQRDFRGIQLKQQL